jgi:hypothetical protein
MHGQHELAARFWQRRSASERVLLACCRQAMTDADRQRVAAAAPRADWPLVLAAAVRHQVAPLVFENLADCPGIAAALPADVRAGFHHATVRNMAAKQAAAAALQDALEWFGGRGIDAMLVKGTALDARLFAQPWRTASADVDLLLRLPGALDGEVWQKIVALNAQSPQLDVHVHRHPDLVMNGVLPVDFDAIWAAARPIPYAGRQVWVMSIEDELLAACINACRKRYFRLKSLLAIRELAASCAELDWPGFARRAVAWRCGGIAYAALVATAISAGCALPADLRRMLRVSRARAALLDFLLVRMGFGSLATIHRHRRVLGKYWSRWLLLRYASLGWRPALGAVRVAIAQMRRRGGGSGSGPATDSRARYRR